MIGDKFNSKVLKFIIGHELGHIKHGDCKITVLEFIKNILRFIITRQCYIIEDKTKEIRADEYARNFCGYTITKEELLDGIFQNYQYVLDDFENLEEDLKLYLISSLNVSGRF